MTPADIRKTADLIRTMDYDVVAETLRALANVVEALQSCDNFAAGSYKLDQALARVEALKP